MLTRVLARMRGLMRLGAAAALVAGPAVAQPDEITIDRLLVLPRVGTSGRSPVYTDAVEHAIVAGTWTIPAAGDVVGRPGGENQVWRVLDAAEDGTFQDQALSAGWALATVESASDRVVILEARGHRSVYVNGEPRVGDVYGLGTTAVPVRLRAGTNTVLFRTGRGSLRARLTAAPAIAMIEARDPTLPEFIRGETEPLYAGVIVTNTTDEWLFGLRVTAAAEGARAVESVVPPIPPLSSYKAPVRLPVATDPSGASVSVRLTLAGETGDPIAERTFDIRVRGAQEKHVRTFISAIDGSVQYYAVTPPASAADGPPALVLTLHGASVEGAGQAAAYEAKPGMYVVAPTNRRPYGFDWEDWGRVDAIEVLDAASARFGADPTRTYLTGHSMGGHGTWIVGAYFAPRFAAIAPSAGWRDFWSYAAAPEAEPDSPVAALLWRAANASRTLLMEQNFASLGVYILHGDADDNVPVAQARFMRERLGTFHPNFAYFEQPGAGHWWGNQCVDWPPMFEFFARNHRPEPSNLRSIDFVTVDPGINGRSAWAGIEAQTLARAPSRITARDRTPGGPIEITTENVARASFDLAALGLDSLPDVVIDGQPLSVLESPLRATRDAAGVWTIAATTPSEAEKQPGRSGPFKEAFGCRMLFVVGTAGTPEENAWALAKARYDAETFWYRGNGAVEIVTDGTFDALDEPDRSVILYGNRDTNTAWDRVVDASPMIVERGRVLVGERHIEGDGLACVFVRPRRGSATASVGIIAGTGLPGMRLTNQLPYFVSGAHFPDWTVIDSSMLVDPAGGRAGVVGCGFFAGDWSLGEDQAWRE